MVESATTSGTTTGPIGLALVAAGERGGIHGHRHWRRVGATGIGLATAEGVSRHVALLFARSARDPERIALCIDQRAEPPTWQCLAQRARVTD